MSANDENKTEETPAGDGENKTDETSENTPATNAAPPPKPPRGGNKPKDDAKSSGKGVKARCIKKRQWKGRIIRPEEDRVFDFPKGIPAGFEDYFEPIQ